MAFFRADCASASHPTKTGVVHRSDAFVTVTNPSVELVKRAFMLRLIAFPPIGSASAFEACRDNDEIVQVGADANLRVPSGVDRAPVREVGPVPNRICDMYETEFASATCRYSTASR